MLDFSALLDTCPNLRVSGVAAPGLSESEFRLDAKMHAQMNAQCAEQFARAVAPMLTWRIDYDPQERAGAVSCEGYVFDRAALMKTLWATYVQGRRDAGEVIQPEMPQ